MRAKKVYLVHFAGGYGCGWIIDQQIPPLRCGMTNEGGGIIDKRIPPLRCGMTNEG
jgi:hypothetical protein